MDSNSTSSSTVPPTVWSAELFNVVESILVLTLVLALCLTTTLFIYLGRSGFRSCKQMVKESRSHTTEIAVLIATLLACKIAVDVVHINIPLMELNSCSNACRITWSISSFLGNICHFTTYLYLWNRVYKIYLKQHNVLGTNLVYFTAALWTFLLLVFLVGSFKTIYSQSSIYSIPFENCSLHLHGCSMLDYSQSITSILMLVACISAQGFILVMIFFLLEKMKISMLERNQGLVNSTMKRLALCSTVCVASDVIMYTTEFMILQYERFTHYTPAWVFFSSWNVTLLINTISLQCSNKEVSCRCPGVKMNKQRVVAVISTNLENNSD